MYLRHTCKAYFSQINNPTERLYTMKTPNNQHPDFGKYVIMRDKDAGVAAGNFVSLDEETKVGVLANARRIWYWEGAASLSQLAMEGVSKPKECKFPVEVTAVKFLNVCEMLYVSPKAEKCIKGVPIWKE
jgi:hypothetical protein